ncbi:MAG: hypothetical protein OXI96_08455 [Acidimicrobiaceae bacterium]|nr:hypothetical protein [Acidimicrobiaceae bacterium]
MFFLLSEGNSTIVSSTSKELLWGQWLRSGRAGCRSSGIGGLTTAVLLVGACLSEIIENSTMAAP